MSLNIDITIFCLTYNHVNYIKDALESFLQQKTIYKYNVFVYDDASTDGTSEILREYAKRYPEIFDIYISSQNIFKNPDRDFLMRKLFKEHVHGKYVAVCEGDDYWIDESKLQKQVEYMEQHLDCSMTAHASLWIDFSSGAKREYHPFKKDGVLSASDIILQPTGNLSTASLVMRYDAFIKDSEFPICEVGDRPWQLSALAKGYVYYFNSIMSVYRYMHDGSWCSQTESSFEKMMIHCYDMVHFLEKYDIYTKKKFHSLIRENCISYLYYGIYSNIDMNSESYVARCKQLDVNTKGKYRKFLEKQCKTFEILKNEHILGYDQRKKLEQYGYIVVMGMGEYSRNIREILKKNNVSYTGHVVTCFDSGMKESECLWELEYYPYDKKNTLVIIAISQKNEESVLEALYNNGFYNYVAPMWVY